MTIGLFAGRLVIAGLVDRKGGIAIVDTHQVAVAVDIDIDIDDGAACAPVTIGSQSNGKRDILERAVAVVSQQSILADVQFIQSGTNRCGHLGQSQLRRHHSQLSGTGGHVARQRGRPLFRGNPVASSPIVPAIQRRSDNRRLR